jgi:hypothetical protein
MLTIMAGRPPRRTLEICERELIQQRSLEIRLRDALAESEAQLRQKDELIQRQELLSKESDHRLRLRAVGFQRRSGVAGRVRPQRQQGTGDEDHSIVHAADRAGEGGQGARFTVLFS